MPLFDEHGMERTMTVYRTRLDQNGRIVVPAAVRERLGVEPGDNLVLDVTSEEIILTSHNAALKKLKGLVREAARTHPYSVEQFLKERRAEADLEERIWQRRRKRRG
jgi:AbrB family looped-hinge helix DNA binding protein